MCGTAIKWCEENVETDRARAEKKFEDLTPDCLNDSGHFRPCVLPTGNK